MSRLTAIFGFAIVTLLDVVIAAGVVNCFWVIAAFCFDLKEPDIQVCISIGVIFVFFFSSNQRP